MRCTRLSAGSTGKGACRCLFGSSGSIPGWHPLRKSPADHRSQTACQWPTDLQRARPGQLLSAVRASSPHNLHHAPQRSPARTCAACNPTTFPPGPVPRDRPSTGHLHPPSILTTAMTSHSPVSQVPNTVPPSRWMSSTDCVRGRAAHHAWQARGRDWGGWQSRRAVAQQFRTQGKHCCLDYRIRCPAQFCIGLAASAALPASECGPRSRHASPKCPPSPRGSAALASGVCCRSLGSRGGCQVCSPPSHRSQGPVQVHAGVCRRA